MSSLRYLPRISKTAIPSRRFASTTTASPTSTSTKSTLPPSQLPLSWPTYLTLRHRKRLFATITSVPTTIGAFFGGAAYFGQIEMDPSQPMLGMDPMYWLIGATIGCGGLGFLLGPTFGNVLFRTLNSSKAKSMEVMEKEFYTHIKRKRGDPSYNDVNNPIPDYYGEKISSLKTYRRWLRDQAIYTRKALHGLKEPVDNAL